MWKLIENKNFYTITQNGL